MSNLKKILSVFVIVILLFGYFCLSYATTVTKENLQEALNAIINDNKTDDSAENKAVVEDGVAKITLGNGKEEAFQYDLTDSPKFWKEITITKGMTYEEYKEAISKIYEPLYGYGAVAKIQGVEDNTMYYYPLVPYLNSELSNENNYIVYDGTENTPEVDGKTLIKESEFGEYAIDYCKDVMPDEKTFNDNDTSNTFSWKLERVDISSDECKVISTITVNPDGDFNKAKEENEKQLKSFVESFDNMSEDMLNQMQDLSKVIAQNLSSKGLFEYAKKTAVENDKAIENNTVTNTAGYTTENTTQTTNNTSKIPYAGKTVNIILNALYLILATATFTILLLAIKNKNK